MQPIRFAARLLAFAIVVTVSSPALADVVASRGDAFVSHEATTDVWSIGNWGIQLSLGLDRSGTLTLQRLVNLVTGDALAISAGADFSLMADSEPIVLSRGSLTFTGATATATDAGVLLTLGFEHRRLRLRFSRSYAVYVESPTIETWTRIESLPGAQPVDLSSLVGWQITVPAGRVKYVGGMRSYAQPGELGTFDLVEGEIEPESPWEIGTDRRSTEDYLPFISIDDGRNTFFGGIMWSGAWRIACERNNVGVRITTRFPESPTVSSSRPIEVPHAFFGVTTHGPAAEPSAIRQFIVNGPRAGRPFASLVTYNTWFAYGTSISEDLLRKEVDRAAAIGVELFVVDAGWYTDRERDSVWDFEAGLGRLTEDRDRFSSSLASLRDYIHNAGLRFGLWVEPERVALNVLDELGVNEGWLATQGGQYGSDKAGQICLAGAPARAWLVDRLSTLIETVGPDYLKWDNNGWINCDRSDHGHGPTDGNFAHVDGLYEVLREIRQRFPNLLIENCSGGGNRLDFGMLALSDAGWMDDRTHPSSRVRHNLEGLTAAFPSVYLLSFVMAGEGEAIAESSDLRNIVRSRMPGVLGMTFRFADLHENAVQILADEIRWYKVCRDIMLNANAVLLSRQAPLFDGWDVLEEVTADGLYGVIFAFKSDLSDDRLRVNPSGLRPEMIYDVYSADSGHLGSVDGESLMLDGIELNHQPPSSLAHVLVLIAQSSSEFRTSAGRSRASLRGR